MKSSLKDFILEAEELLEEAENTALELQDASGKGFNPDLVNGLFRAIHTIKGLSGLFQLKEISDFSHVFESLLDNIRLGKIPLEEGVIDFILKNIDILRHLVSAASEKRFPDVRGYIKDIESFIKASLVKEEEMNLEGIIEPSILGVLSQYEEHRLKSNLREGKGIYICESIFALETFDTELKSLSDRIKERGELIATMPVVGDLPPDRIGFRLLFSTYMSPDDLKKSGIEARCLVEVKKEKKTTLGEKEYPEKDTEKKKEDRTSITGSNTVKVDIEKLDTILNTLGELSLTKGAVKRVGDELKRAYGISPLIFDIHKIADSLEKRIYELQDEILALRLIPLGQIFARVAQMVRRHAREVNKQVEVHLFGEDTELDKSLADSVMEPLMHIARNAIDHGIESPEERRTCGKPETGVINFRAYQKGNHVVIEVSDDGRGIELERVRKKAIERGLIQEDRTIEKDELIDLIYLPGFTTKDEVTEVSGRGVGMDVVKEKLSHIGGFVEIETEKGKETTVRLTVPITLAIIKSIIVRVGDKKFALPLTSIMETLSISQEDIRSVEGREVYNLRGHVLPLIRISEILGITVDRKNVLEKISRRRLRNKGGNNLYMVVAGIGEKRVGIIVDELLDQEEIVIKPLGEYLDNIRWFAGAAEIGRHELVLILDVESFLREATKKVTGQKYV